MRVALEPVQTREYSPIREEVFSMLREAILKGKLCPGDRLVERELAEQLGVSRTPVREALRKLELENLVTHIPRRGVIVSEISRRDVVEIYDIRGCLEGLAARLAAEKRTREDLQELEECIRNMNIAGKNGANDEMTRYHDQFNRKILEIAGSPRLTQMVNSLADYISRFTKAGYSAPGRISVAMKEHEELFDAVSVGDSKRAGQIAEAHIVNSKAVVLRQYEQFGEPKLANPSLEG